MALTVLYVPSLLDSGSREGHNLFVLQSRNCKATNLICHYREGRNLLFRGGLVFMVHRLVYHSTLGLRIIKKKGEPVVLTNCTATHLMCKATRLICIERGRNLLF